MTKVLYIAASLNGFIATPDDDTPWSNELWENYYAYIKKVGNIIVGRRTYEMMDEVGEFAKLNNPFTVVVTKQDIFKNSEKIRFVNSIEDALNEVEEMGFHTAVLGGGSQLNTSALKSGLIDEIEIDIEPFVFGKGVPLFGSSNVELDLKLQSVDKINQNTIHLRYKVAK